MCTCTDIHKINLQYGTRAVHKKTYSKILNISKEPKLPIKHVHKLLTVNDFSLLTVIFKMYDNKDGLKHDTHMYNFNKSTLCLDQLYT